MKMALLFPLLALAAGALIPVQAAANSALSQSLRSVIYASLVLFAIGLVFVLGVAVAHRIQPPSFSQFAMVPAFGYIGGVIVAIYVFVITFLAPRMGVGNAICYIVTGQIVAAVAIDHLGLLGASLHEIGWQRAVGVACMICGTFLARN